MIQIDKYLPHYERSHHDAILNVFSSKIMDNTKNTVYIVRIDVKVGESEYKGSKKAMI